MTDNDDDDFIYLFICLYVCLFIYLFIGHNASKKNIA